jgi:hypothetical protein
MLSGTVSLQCGYGIGNDNYGQRKGYLATVQTDAVGIVSTQGTSTVDGCSNEY